MPDCPGALTFAHMRDGEMIRLRFPGGKLSRPELQALAALSKNFGNGLLDLTNRANIQIRGLNRKHFSPEDLTTALDEAGFLSQNPWSDRLRNIMADPLDYRNCGDTNSSAVVMALDEELQNTPSLAKLSPKFCFIIDNGSPYQISTQPHDLALIALPFFGKSLYQLSLAGHLTSLCVSEDKAANLLIQIANYICHFGHEVKRVSHLLQKFSLEEACQHILEFAPYCIKSPPDNKADLTPPPIGLIKGQKPAYSLGLGVPTGRLTAQQIFTLAKFCQHVTETPTIEHKKHCVTLSPWQIIYVHNIPASQIEITIKTAKQAGFITDPNFLNSQVFACSGSSGCPRTEAPAKEEGLTLIKLLKDDPVPSTEQAIKIHISGCARSCALASQADIVALAQTDGSGYHLYENTSIAKLRLQESPLPPLIQGNIAQVLFNRIKDK